MLNDLGARRRILHRAGTAYISVQLQRPLHAWYAARLLSALIRQGCSSHLLMPVPVKIVQYVI